MSYRIASHDADLKRLQELLKGKEGEEKSKIEKQMTQILLDKKEYLELQLNTQSQDLMAKKKQELEEKKKQIEEEQARIETLMKKKAELEARKKELESQQ
eukprot:TRINITY_DN3671_c0_g1_i1.p1 TRINITY_DN3671_c0_g1~~TRINITY_DN3671_c0_g1_i1.p1  ORF type:complete len:100 (+),score=39.71 TRINITY_DN3671_c0_g1_i1:206-505(+)